MDSLLSHNIADSMDEAMQSYTDSDEYLQMRDSANRRISDFRSKLPESARIELDQVINANDAFHAAFAEKAYVTGVVNGIALRESIMPRSKR